MYFDLVSKRKSDSSSVPTLLMSPVLPLAW